ncbi:hypothetical protein L7F22_011135 [Adiantum nelumboides]|nr:hypothetical protein [Adiantum nelumboides]
MAGKAKKGGREEMRGTYSTPLPKKSATRTGRGSKQLPLMRATQSRAGPTLTKEVKEVKGDLFLAVSQPMAVVLKPCQPLPSKTAAMTGERKKTAPKVHTQTVQTLDQGDPLLAVVDPKPCKLAAVNKRGKKKAPKAQQREEVVTLQALKISKHSDQEPEPLSCKPAAVTKEGKKGALEAQQPEQGLKIATPAGQDAPLSTDVPREPCQGATLKKAPKAPKGLKIAMPAGQDAPLLADVPWEPCQGVTLKKVPKEAQPTKQAQKSGQSKEVSSTMGTQPGAPKAPKEDQCLGSGPLKAQKSGQAKEMSGTVGFKPPRTQVNKRKVKADVKEKEGTTVPKQHNVKKLKKMKKVGIREVKVKGTWTRDSWRKCKIALKRDGMKKMAKKHVEKGLEDKEPADKALALVGSSKRSKLQVKGAKQSGGSCTTSTTMTSKTSNEKPYVEVINGDKLVRICRAEPPCASRNTLMEKRSRMMQHVKKRIEERAKDRAALTRDVLPCKAQKAMKKDTFIKSVVNHMKMVNQKEEAMRKEIKSHVEEGYKSRCQIKVGMLIAKGDKGKSSEGSDDGGDEDDGSSQDGGGDDDSDDGSNEDADDDDGGSDVSGGGDDKAAGENDGTDDKDDGSGSDEGDSEGVSEQDDVQDVSTDEDEVQEILSSPTSFLA